MAVNGRDTTAQRLVAVGEALEVDIIGVEVGGRLLAVVVRVDEAVGDDLARDVDFGCPKREDGQDGSSVDGDDAVIRD